MKKLLAIVLSVLCIFSCFALPAAASKGGVIGELANTFFEGFFDIEIEEDTSIGYGVIYETDPLMGISVVYKPSPSVSFTNPGIYTITSDTPLSIDYEFICWKDNKGNLYYPGDKIFVDGTITLYAEWVEKNDNDVRVARIIKTTFEAFKRLISKFFGILDIVVNFEPTLSEPGKYDLTLNEIYYDDATKGNEKVLLYIDSRGIYTDTKMKRIDKLTKEDIDKFADNPELQERLVQSDVEISLCTGWDIATKEPLAPMEFTGITYKFEPLKGPKGEDVVVISTVFNDGSDIVSKYLDSAAAKEYFANNPDANKFYMTVTINDSLYSAPKTASDGFHESCNPVSVVFTLTK